MKTLLLLLVTFLLPGISVAQNRVQFMNSETTYLWTNYQGTLGLMAGSNAYRIGLYVAPAGTADSSTFSLVGLATNHPTLPGRFIGGNPFPIPNNTGERIAFQIRAWSFFAGTTYEQAVDYRGPELVFGGMSTIGEVTPTPVPFAGARLFGTDPGQVSPFILSPIPEPSVWTLLCVGVMSVVFFRRMRHCK